VAHGGITESDNNNAAARVALREANENSAAARVVSSVVFPVCNTGQLPVRICIQLLQCDVLAEVGNLASQLFVVAKMHILEN